METAPLLDETEMLPKEPLDVESIPLTSGVVAALKLITFSTMRRVRINQHIYSRKAASSG